MKKFLLFLINLIGISFYAHALIISEIMYDPQGSDTSREWIEVYNDTASDINLSTFKFFESGTNHGLVASQGGTTLSPNVYAVIADNPAKFLLDYPSFSGILFDSSFSLSNSGEFIVMKDGSGTQIDSVNYSTALGGNDDGSTLSFINNAWTRGQATPASENISSPVSLVATTTSEITLPRALMSAPGADITFILPEDKIVVAGADANFTARAINSDKKQIEGLNYTWTFGDGGTKLGKSVGYNYSYPGYYIAYVEAQNEHISGSDRIRVRVISPDIEITDSGEGARGAFIDLKNNSNSDMDISHWFLETSGLRYPLPTNTIISGGKATRFSGTAMGFLSATGTIRLLFPDGNVVAEKSTTTLASPMNINFIRPLVLGVSTTTVNTNNRTMVFAKKDIGKEIIKPKKQEEVASTSSSTIKIVINKNTGIADFLKRIFGF